MKKQRNSETRPDLMFRNMPAGETDDPRWNDIDDKIIAYMHRMDPSEWQKEMWQLMLLRVKNNQMSGRKGPTEQMSSDDLLASLTGSPSNTTD